jgi:TPR repeat protein
MFSAIVALALPAAADPPLLAGSANAAATVPDAGAAPPTLTCTTLSPDDCAKLARRFRFGEGTAVDRKKSALLYQEACDRGSSAGCHELADQLQGDKKGQSVRLYERACELHDLLACSRAAQEYQARSHSSRAQAGDQERAIQWWNTACQHGEGQACLLLANRYWTGNGVTRDRGKARALRRRAVKLGAEDRE